MDILEFVSHPCPLCGSREKKTLGKPMKIDALFSSLNIPTLSEVKIVACPTCSLIYVDPFPCFSESLLKKMYAIDNNYFQELTPYMENVIHNVNPARRFKTAQRFSKNEIKSFLEIGCGQGFGLLAAQKMGWNAYGQEISSDFAEIAKKRTGCKIIIGPLDENSFPEKYFNIVYIDSVLEHVADPVFYMHCILKFLAPGGIVYLTIPNENSIPNQLMDLSLKLAGDDRTSRIQPFTGSYHLFGFSTKSIQYLANKMHLKIPYLIRHYSYNHVERYKRSFSAGRFFKKKIFGLIYLLSNAVDNGMNMELVFTQ